MEDFTVEGGHVGRETEGGVGFVEGVLDHLPIGRGEDKVAMPQEGVGQDRG